MSERLTAAELYAIYTPAFEAAGEQPRHLKFYRNSAGEVKCERHPEMEPVCIDDAANACRCWAEDWLRVKTDDRVTISCGCSQHSEDGTEVEVLMVVDVRPGTEEQEYFGPTIHEALSAAVVAVATAKRAVPGPTGPSPT